MSEPDHSKDTKKLYLIKVWLVLINHLKHLRPYIVCETPEWQKPDVKSHVEGQYFMNQAVTIRKKVKRTRQQLQSHSETQ